MAYLVMDDCLGRLFTVRTSYNTSVTSMRGGGEERSAHWAMAKRAWEFSTRDRLMADIIALDVFHHEVMGRYEVFIFKQLTDFNHWQLPSDISPIVIATGDAVTVAVQLVKFYGSGATRRTRTVTNPISGTVKIYLNAVLQTITTHYTIDHDTGIVTFVAPPGGGVAISAGYEFRNRARFDSDDLVIEPVDERRKYGRASIGIVEVAA